MSYRERRSVECQKLFSGFCPEISSKCRNKEKVLQVVLLASQGFYSAEIAEKLDCTPKSIQKLFRYYNLPVLHNFSPPLLEERQGWKGGMKVVKDYEYQKTPNHPNKSKHGGYVAVHRLVIEQHLGRFLTRVEVVDHIDGDTRNNKIENLRVFANNAEHLRVTLKGRCPNWTEEGKEKIIIAVKAARRKEAANHPRSRNDAGQYI